MIGVREKRLTDRVKVLRSRMQWIGLSLETADIVKKGDRPRQKCLRELKAVRDEIDDILREQDQVWIL